MPATLEDLRETLTAASGASGLVPKIIDRLLLEYQRKYAPLHKAFPRKTWETNTYYFNERTALPQAQMTTEAPTTTQVAATSSTFQQLQFPIMHSQVQLDISTFAAKVAVVNGNLFDLELAAAAKSMAWNEEIVHLWGAQNATTNTLRPQWNGVDQQIGSANKINGGGSASTLIMLDNLIDSVRGVAAQELDSDWFFCISPKMSSRINGLFVNQQRFNEGMTMLYGRDDFGFPNAPVVDNKIGVNAGVEVQTYRSIPIVVSNFMSNSLGQMGAISTTNNTGAGSNLVTTSTYYYIVEAVTRFGLLYGSAEVSASPAANGNNIVLSWATPTPTDAFGNVIDIMGYRIYRGTASGTETLYALSSAYNNSDVAVTSFTDSGLAQNPITNNALFAATITTSGNAASDGVTYPRLTATTEDILLLPRNPEYLVVPVVNEIQSQMLAPINARTRQFALTSDLTLAMRAGLFGAKLYNVKTA